MVSVNKVKELRNMRWYDSNADLKILKQWVEGYCLNMSTNRNLETG